MLHLVNHILGRGLYAASGESQFYVTKNEFSFRDFLSRALTNKQGYLPPSI